MANRHRPLTPARRKKLLTSMTPVFLPLGDVWLTFEPGNVECTDGEGPVAHACPDAAVLPVIEVGMGIEEPFGVEEEG